MSCDHPASVGRRLIDGDTLADLRATAATVHHMESCAECAATFARVVIVAERVSRGGAADLVRGDRSWVAVRDGIRRTQRRQLIVRGAMMAAAAAITVVAFAGSRRVHPSVPPGLAGGVHRDAERVEALATFVVAHLAEDTQLKSHPFWEGPP